MIVGFTATENGLTGLQCRELKVRLRQLVAAHDDAAPLLTNHGRYPEFHHGDCVGGDAQGAALAHEVGFRIHCHPPRSGRKRAFTKSYSYIYPPLPYLDRDREIARVCQVLIGCPAEYSERLRSGTWATLRYARKAKKNLCIIFPDGSVKDSF